MTKFSRYLSANISACISADTIGADSNIGRPLTGTMTATVGAMATAIGSTVSAFQSPVPPLKLDQGLQV